jgi:hypothetical protein
MAIILVLVDRYSNTLYAYVSLPDRFEKAHIIFISIQTRIILDQDLNYFINHFTPALS